MGKKRAGPSVAIAPAAGTKMTFGDDDDFDIAAPSSPGMPSNAPSDEEDDEESGSGSEDDDSDSDAAPEAVGMRSGAANERKRAAAEEEERRAKREAAKLRAARVAEAKAASKKPSKEKRKRPAAPSDDESEDDDDPEAARLRRRMEAAMAAGDGDSEMDDSEMEDESDFDEDGEDDFDALEDEEEEEGEEDGGEEEEEDEDEEDEEEESDEEGLFSRPVPAALKSKMDAMMAAMEGRAMAADSKFADEMAARRAKGPVLEVPRLKSALKKSQPSSKVKGTKTTFDEFGEYEAAPLSADMLAAADAQLAAEKSTEKAEKVERARKRRRKGGSKGKAGPTARVLDDRTVHLLPPVLAGTALPPVVGPRERVGDAGKAKQNFFKRAMKASGKIPGKGIVDGRRR